MQGDIRWQPASRNYAVTIGSVSKEFAVSRVRAVRVPEPAGMSAAVKAVKAEKYAKAIPVLDKIVISYSMLQWDVPAARWLAQAYLGMGNAPKAIDMCERVIRVNRDAAFSGELAGIYWDALLKAGRDAKLEQVLREAVETGGREVAAVAQLKRGDILKKKGNLKYALVDGYLRTALLFRDIKKVQPEAMFKAAECFQQLGQRLDVSRHVNRGLKR